MVYLLSAQRSLPFDTGLFDGPWRIERTKRKEDRKPRSSRRRALASFRELHAQLSLTGGTSALDTSNSMVRWFHPPPWIERSCHESFFSRRRGSVSRDGKSQPSPTASPGVLVPYTWTGVRRRSSSPLPSVLSRLTEAIDRSSRSVARFVSVNPSRRNPCTHTQARARVCHARRVASHPLAPHSHQATTNRQPKEEERGGTVCYLREIVTAFIALDARGTKRRRTENFGGRTKGGAKRDSEGE